jgi:hypothetical protein
MSENIVDFPKKITDNFISKEQSLQHIEEIRKEYCNEIASDALEAVMSVVNNYGLQSKEDQPHIKDIIFVEEAIKALTYRYKRLTHPLHDIIESTVSLPGDANFNDSDDDEETKVTDAQLNT